MRVTRAGIPVIEADRHHPADRLLHHPAAPGPGEQHVLLGPLERCQDGVLMRPVDHGLGVRVGDRPQRRHRLRHAERQVEPGHRTGNRLAPRRDPPGHRRGTQLPSGEWILQQPEQPKQVFLARFRAFSDTDPIAQPGEPGAEEPSLGGARVGVVAGQRRRVLGLRVAAGDRAQQVLIPRAQGHPPNRDRHTPRQPASGNAPTVQDAWDGRTAMGWVEVGVILEWGRGVWQRMFVVSVSAGSRRVRGQGHGSR